MPSAVKHATVDACSRTAASAPVSKEQCCTKTTVAPSGMRLSRASRWGTSLAPHAVQNAHCTSGMQRTHVRTWLEHGDGADEVRVGASGCGSSIAERHGVTVRGDVSNAHVSDT